MKSLTEIKQKDVCFFRVTELFKYFKKKTKYVQMTINTGSVGGVEIILWKIKLDGLKVKS